MDEKTLKDLKVYCNHVLKNFVPKENFKNKKFLETIFLQILFNLCTDKLNKGNGYEIDSLELKKILTYIEESENLFEKIITHKVDVVEVDEDDNIKYNFEKEQKLLK